VKRALIIGGVVGLTVLSLMAATVWGARSVEMPADHTEQWISLHGREAAEDLERCRECHDELACRACHLAEWPHEEAWQSEHGAVASSTEARGCYLCHTATYCDPCHGGVHMPHPADFLVQHSTGSFAQASCGVCHPGSDCDACHREHGSHQSGGLVVR